MLQEDGMTFAAIENENSEIFSSYASVRGSRPSYYYEIEIPDDNPKVQSTDLRKCLTLFLLGFILHPVWIAVFFMYRHSADSKAQRMAKISSILFVVFLAAEVILGAGIFILIGAFFGFEFLLKKYDSIPLPKH